MEAFVQEIAFSLENFGTGAYLIVSLVVLLETIVVIGQFIPGSLFLILIGFLCYAKVFDFSGMLASVYISHLAGELINYGLGRYKGRGLFHSDSRFFKPRFLDMAEARFRVSGSKILIVGQFLGFLRPYIALAAGASHYSRLRFVVAMLVACLLWSLLPLGLGFLGGASWQQAVLYMKDFSLVLLVAIPTGTLSWWMIRRLLASTGDLRAILERLNGRIRRLPAYQHLSTRHPHVFRFLERRISLSRTWGLGATAGFAMAAAFTAMFAGILWNVSGGDRWRDLDLSVVNLLAQIRNPVSDQIFLVITHLGTGPVVFVVAVLAAILCLAARQQKSLFVIVGSVILAMAIGQITKHIYGRARPEMALHLVEEDGFSFPSGHASAAFAMFGSLYYWLWNHPGVLRIRATLAFILLLMAFLIGFSRVYLGVHYPSDVLAGFCLGCAAVFATATTAVNWSRLADVQRRADLPAMTVLMAYGMLAFGYSFLDPVIPPKKIIQSVPAEAERTLHAALAELPRRAKTVFGFNYLPVNLVLAGNADLLISELEKLNWKLVRPADFFSRDIGEPVFPAFVNGKPAAITLNSPTSETRILLRLWQSDVYVNGQHVWVGSVLNQSRRKKWGALRTFQQTADIDASVDELMRAAAPLNPGLITGFRNRGLYVYRKPFFTHGNAALFELDGPAESP